MTSNNSPSTFYDIYSFYIHHVHTMRPNMSEFPLKIQSDKTIFKHDRTFFSIPTPFKTCSDLDM